MYIVHLCIVNIYHVLKLFHSKFITERVHCRRNYYVSNESCEY